MNNPLFDEEKMRPFSFHRFDGLSTITLMCAIFANNSLILLTNYSRRPLVRKTMKSSFVAGLAAIILTSCGGGAANSSDDSGSTNDTVEMSSEDTVADTTTTTTIAVPTTFKSMTDREWKLLNKNPDAMAGTGVRLAGQIIQFDARTGTGTFKSIVYRSTGERASDSYLNNMTIADISGSESLLANFLKDDKFICDCVIVKAEQYTTQNNETRLSILMNAVTLKVG